MNFNTGFAHLNDMPSNIKELHQKNINSISKIIYKQFEEMKRDINIEDDSDQEDNKETEDALKELYPELDLKISDILKNNNSHQYLKSSIATKSYNTINANTNSYSALSSYGLKDRPKEAKRVGTSFNQLYHNRNNSLNIISPQESGFDIINILPKIRPKSPENSKNLKSIYEDPLGIRRLGIYKGSKFSLSNKSRDYVTTQPTVSKAILIWLEIDRFSVSTIYCFRSYKKIRKINSLRINSFKLNFNLFNCWDWNRL